MTTTPTMPTIDPPYPDPNSNDPAECMLAKMRAERPLSPGPSWIGALRWDEIDYFEAVIQNAFKRAYGHRAHHSSSSTEEISWAVTLEDGRRLELTLSATDDDWDTTPVTSTAPEDPGVCESCT